VAARVALIDSGVHAAHPHIAGRVEIEQHSAGPDLLGHGTCVAAAILDLAPSARILSLRVFEGELSCPFERVLAALERALACEVELINLSLGTTDACWRAPLEAALAAAQRRSITVVAPAAASGLPSYPGCLEGAAGTLIDATLPRERPELRAHGARSMWYASPYPRDLPGLPRSANMWGPSLAAANVTGHLAAQRER
jgi:subtilisin family serine protease